MNAVLLAAVLLADSSAHRDLRYVYHCPMIEVNTVDQGAGSTLVQNIYRMWDGTIIAFDVHGNSAFPKATEPVRGADGKWRVLVHKVNRYESNGSWHTNASTQTVIVADHAYWTYTFHDPEIADRQKIPIKLRPLFPYLPPLDAGK